MFREIREDKLKSSNISKFYLIQHKSLNVEIHRDNQMCIRDSPDPSKRFYLQTDASRYALGGQLYQLDENNEIGVVAFTSRVVRGAERNYFTTELELLSVVHCLQKFRTYVLGKPLTIITDNKALIFIKQCHLNNSCLLYTSRCV